MDHLILYIAKGKPYVYEVSYFVSAADKAREILKQSGDDPNEVKIYQILQLASGSYHTSEVKLEELVPKEKE